MITLFSFTPQGIHIGLHEYKRLHVFWILLIDHGRKYSFCTYLRAPVTG